MEEGRFWSSIFTNIRHSFNKDGNLGTNLFTIKFAISLGGIVVATYPIYTFSLPNGLAASAIMSTLALASLGSGALLGFIFSLPRLKKKDLSKRPFSDNDNLEHVSDWLLSTIVALGITQLTSIPYKLQEVGEYIESASHGLVCSVVATSTLVGFTTLGFLYIYLWTRLVVMEAFNESYNNQKEFTERVSRLVQYGYDPQLETILKEFKANDKVKEAIKRSKEGNGGHP